MAKRAESQNAQIGDAVGRLGRGLSARADATTAGRAIERGVMGPGGFMERTKGVQQGLYGELDNHIPANTRIGVGQTA